LNYYEHHLGDYAAATAHLSWDEDMAYQRLIRAYYHHERPIPVDLKAACRLVRAETKVQRQAVETVLREFFDLGPEGWRQKRCDAEIERYRDKQAKAARSANARWAAKQTQSDGNANASTDAMRTHSEGNALQTPDTRHQKNPVVPSGPTSAQPTLPSVPEEPEKAAAPTIPCPYAQIVERYHARLPDLPRAKLMPPSRQRAMRKVWGWVLGSSKSDGTRRATTAEEALRWLDGYFLRASQNDFLMGRTPRSAEHANWRCDLDFLLTERGMKHVIEGTQEAAA
jgi:uncharacterized protein YdaU (DUF1376 family)